MTAPIRVSIIGGSGYGGGELLRLLLGHPHVAIGQVTSESQAGNFVHAFTRTCGPRADARLRVNSRCGSPPPAS